MERVNERPRTDWVARVQALGFDFHTMHGQPYWVESASYRFGVDEIDTLHDATDELQRLCLSAVEHIVQRRRFAEFAIPENFRPFVERSWRDHDPEIYGRFDLVYDGRSAPKLLEYNADTPTSLLEASVIQWFWLKDVHPDADQFNLIHERLIEVWRAAESKRPFATVYFASVHDSDEDRTTCAYMRDVCTQAGFVTEEINMTDIGWNGNDFTDLKEQPIRRMFKLYPWEWLVREEFGAHLLKGRAEFTEPAWKMLLSNKALLPILWELNPGHPNLLPSFRSKDPLESSYVRKPILSREGANVTIVHNGGEVAAPGAYGEEGCIYQAYQPLPVFDGYHAVVGSWVIGGKAAGIGIREDSNPITGNLSRFVPHYFMK
jgi:glutathionylspermidine synthase